MRKLTDLREAMPVFKALSSETRISILEILGKEGPLSMTGLSERTGLTAGSLTPHIRMLQACGIIEISMSEGKHGLQKICRLNPESLLIEPVQDTPAKTIHEAEIGVGEYTSFHVFPTCGLCTQEHIIGRVDNPAVFSDPNHGKAEILWLGRGWVEYTLPSLLMENEKALEIQITMEISSEAPGIAEDWPSDICFSLNGISIGTWTSPGDYGRIPGIYNPSWWFPNWNQHGLFKLLSINNRGTFIDGMRISDIILDDLDLRHGKAMLFRIGVSETGDHVGGLTIFGHGFGNYPQDIHIRMHYAQQE